jgi:phosphatidylglycerol:prolipoprotein diacylglycerol transferase
MQPTLFSVGRFGVDGYGLALAAGFLAALTVATRAAARDGLEPTRVRDLGFYLLAAGVVGARLLFVVTNAGFYVDACRAGPWWACLRPLAVWEGGLVFYGGLLGALLVAATVPPRLGLDRRRAADAVAPALALGHAIGRVGCFLAGCCWGRPTSLPIGVRFPPESAVFADLVTRGLLSPAAARTPPLHPVQLYEAVGELALFAALTWLARRRRYPGQVALAWVIGYGLLRATVELLRGDPGRRLLFGPISTSQLIAALTIAAALAVGARLRRGELSRA